MITKSLAFQRLFNRTALFAGIFSAVSAFAQQAATPTFSPIAGTYASAQSVTISTTTSGANIRYTTDGSTPTETNGTVYSGAVSINSSTQLNAIAYKSGDTDSTVISGLYTITSSPGPSLNVLYNFTGSNDGAIPNASLVQGTDGNFYGTAEDGGGGGVGNVFKMTPAGVFTTLVSFDLTTAGYPGAGLVQGIDGNFYGTASSGGSDFDGAVFRMTPAGALSILVSFTGANGQEPFAGLVQGIDGNFYGTTGGGGSSSNGTVFELTPAGAFATLASFNGTNGEDPFATLVQGSDGNFYGSTGFGGNTYVSPSTPGDGTVFKITPAGTLTTLVSFTGANGQEPVGSLVQGTDGNFYGTTQFGGSSNDGTVFKMTPAGTLTTLVTFTGANGQWPRAGLVQGSDGNFYGTTDSGGSTYVSPSTPGDGTIFRMTPAGVLTTLVNFTGANGQNPYAGLVQGSDGNFYGTTGGGGSFHNGIIFQLIIPQAAAPAFSPTAGTYTSAQTVTITSATSGASIRYTTDGSTPSETNGTLYSSSVTIGGTTTLNAIAYEAGFTDSAVSNAVYTLDIPGVEQAPTFSPGGGTYPSAQSVTITSATAGASIAYTTDGSTPTESGGSVNHGASLSNGGSVSISATTTLKAIAYDGINTDSTASAAAYTIEAAAPTFSPVAGTYTSVQSVTITTATSGASFAYTTDGTTPTESGGAVTHGTLYSGAISISVGTSLKAIAFKSGLADSNPTIAYYVMDLPQVATPTFSPAAGTYGSVQSVTISTTTSGALIAYTTDGSIPTESSGTVTHGTLYSTPVSISGASTNLRAIGFEAGDSDSIVAGGVYTIQAAAPTFSPGAGSYTSAQSVSISTTTSGASIRYTIDGSTPTETYGTLYSTPVTFSGAATNLSAIAYKSGYTDSIVTSAEYFISYPPTTPIFSPGAGTYGTTQSVTISSAGYATTIRYTTDGSTPSETNGTIYSGPVSINSSTVLKAIAYESGFPDTSVTSSIYTITSSPGTILNVIYNFATANNGGITPFAALVQGTDGYFYGTTNQGGSSNAGTVFKITPAGVLTTLVTFNGGNGEFPFAGVVQGTDGNFYGTTNVLLSNPSTSFLGTAFKVTPAGALTTLVSFSGANGIYPFAGLIQGTDGNFYGMTFGGGTADYGTVFELTPSGALTPLVSLTGSNGAFPYANLVQGSDGNFYGTTYAGGNTFVAGSDPGDGTVFQTTPAGVLTTLVNFTGANGEFPAASLVQGNDGNFYGTTSEDTVNDDGTVFKMTPAGALTTLVYFNSTTGQTPNGLVQGSDGNFYGTTEGTDSGGSYGTVFKITPTGTLTTLASFDTANGDQPLADLVQGTDGNFYGTASEGGSSYSSPTSRGYGVVFQLIVPPGTAAPAFNPTAGTYASAQSVAITSKTNGASIRYTTNGSTPTETTGTLYSGPVNISSTTTINAIAFKSGLADSAVIGPVYTIQAATTSPSPTPTPTPTTPASSGGGGGGAFDDWFLGCLAFAGILRRKLRKVQGLKANEH